MANEFSFQMSEAFLRGYADYLKQLREGNPGKAYRVTISVGFFPDGIGYEITSPPTITVDEEQPEEVRKPLSPTRSALQGERERKGEQQKQPRLHKYLFKEGKRVEFLDEIDTEASNLTIKDEGRTDRPGYASYLVLGGVDELEGDWKEIFEQAKEVFEVLEIDS